MTPEFMQHYEFGTRVDLKDKKYVAVAGSQRLLLLMHMIRPSGRTKKVFADLTTEEFILGTATGRRCACETVHSS